MKDFFWVFSSRIAYALLCSVSALLPSFFKWHSKFAFDFINNLVLHLKNLLLCKCDKARFVLQKQLKKFPLLISKEISTAEGEDIFVISDMLHGGEMIVASCISSS